MLSAVTFPKLSSRGKLLNASTANPPITVSPEAVIDRPMRVFAPGFGAGAVGGYVVMRVDPAIVAR